MTTLSRLIAELRRLHQEASAGLLACPFCGQEGVIEEKNKGFAVICENGECMCAFGEGYHGHVFDSTQEAIAAWNRRANLAPNLADMLETAERALRHIAFEPLGFSDATHAEALETATERATAALAELERLAGPPLSK